VKIAVDTGADDALRARVGATLGYALPAVATGYHLVAETHDVPRAGEILTLVHSVTQERLRLRVTEVERFAHTPGRGVYVPTVYVKELE
jgi:hypothetical protein